MTIRILLCQDDAHMRLGWHTHPELSDLVAIIDDPAATPGPVYRWQVTEPAVFDDMDDEVYHADPVLGGSLSQSLAKQLLQPAGPARVRELLDHGQPPNRDYELGHAAHRVVLGTGPELRVIPDSALGKGGQANTNAAREFIDQARADGATPLKPSEMAVVTAMADKLCEHPRAIDVLDGRHEVSAFRQDPDTGVWLRARFDALRPDGIGDYKTTTDADPDKFARKAAINYGYYLQAAHYIDTAAAFDLIDPARFEFVLQEKTPPFLVSVVELTPEFVDIGRAHMRRAIQTWIDCRETGVWPGFPTGTVTVAPPPWFVAANDPGLDPAEEAALLDLITRLEGETAS